MEAAGCGAGWELSRVAVGRFAAVALLPQACKPATAHTLLLASLQPTPAPANPTPNRIIRPPTQPTSAGHPAGEQGPLAAGGRQRRQRLAAPHDQGGACVPVSQLLSWPVSQLLSWPVSQLLRWQGSRSEMAQLCDQSAVC